MALPIKVMKSNELMKSGKFAHGKRGVVKSFIIKGSDFFDEEGTRIYPRSRVYFPLLTLPENSIVLDVVGVILTPKALRKEAPTLVKGLNLCTHVAANDQEDDDAVKKRTLKVDYGTGKISQWSESVPTDATIGIELFKGAIISDSTSAPSIGIIGGNDKAGSLILNGIESGTNILVSYIVVSRDEYSGTFVGNGGY